MLFRRKKKDDIHKGDLLVTDGIYLKQASMHNGNIVLNCFLRALIVFFLVLGSIGGFLSAFNISYNYIMVIIVYLILSMYFSFLYAATKFIYRDLGYIVFFGFFVGAIYLLRIYANSGFYTIVNEVMNKAKSFFDLAGVRQYEVQIDNGFLTVSIVACFIGLVMIIVLNIWMYSIMSMFWTVLFTFPLLFIPIYMKLSPDPIYIVFMMVGYLAVLVFKANGHYVVFAWDAPFKVRGFKKKRVTYTQDSTIFGQMITSLLIMSLCLVIIASNIMNPAKFEKRFKNGRLWNATSDAVGNFVLLGFSSFFNLYSSTGGMSSGRLGGISNVRPDYLTDLRVRFVPYSNEAVYLKGFTGGRYGDNQWDSVYDKNTTDAGDQEIFEEESLKVEAESLRDDNGQYSANGKFVVYNEGADTAYLYYPYYTIFDDYTIYNNHELLGSTQGIAFGQDAEYRFYPKIVWEPDLLSTKIKDIDNSKVNKIFMEVPDKNKDVIDNICDDIGLNEDMTEMEAVDAVKQFFEDNYPYTLKPGRTPDKEDFVNYFLTKNKKGYCAHFASSAVLIFREMGIPARYIEGYAFSMESVFASEEAEWLDSAEYYEGYNALGEAPVMQVEVSDAQAHAWVEIYVDGFGWRNVEVTPGSNEVTEENDFWSAFSDILRGGLGNSDDGTQGAGLGNLNLEKYSWIIYVIMFIVVSFIILAFIKIILRSIRRYRLCNQHNRRDAVIARYADVCDMIRVCDKAFDGCRSHREQLLYMQKMYGVLMDADRLTVQLEKMSFHDEYPDEQQLDEICNILMTIKKAILKKAGFRNRFKLWRR